MLQLAYNYHFKMKYKLYEKMQTENLHILNWSYHGVHSLE